jgi:REP element-mobilizing transposase RayT
MSRPLRIEYPGAFYHVTSRGNERKDVFKSKRDREKFLLYLESATERYGAKIHVYCLMSNHYHLLIETPGGNLSQVMRHINGAYTTYFNRKRQRSGHLFQGRYKAILVEADEYATQLSRYIHLNPVRAGIVGSPGDYPWSSYPYYTGQKKSADWLVTDFVLSFFGQTTSAAPKAYRDFVEVLEKEEYESPLKEVFASTILGGEGFIKDIQGKYLAEAGKNRNVPALTELTVSKTIEEIREAVEGMFGSEPRISKKVALHVCHRYSGKKLKEIGICFGVGESAVSQTSRRFETILAKDKAIRRKVENLYKELGLSDV